MRDNTKQNFLPDLIILIERQGFECLECLDPKEIAKPLIRKYWIGTGGKLGYKALASRYGLSVSVVRTICKSFNRVSNVAP